MPPSIERQKKAVKHIEQIEILMIVMYVAVIIINIVCDGAILEPVILSVVLIAWSFVSKKYKNAIWPEIFKQKDKEHENDKRLEKYKR